MILDYGKKASNKSKGDAKQTEVFCFLVSVTSQLTCVLYQEQ
jgi:hypothetical protein